MNIIKPLSYYIQRYLGIERDVIKGRLPLVDGARHLDALYTEYSTDNVPQRSPDRLVLADQTEPNQVALWTSGDGSRKAVGAMSDAHVYYALAKAGRGEYPDCASKATGIRALKLEAFRRLRNELVK